MPNEINGFRPRTLDTNTNKSADRAEQSASRKTPASAPPSPGTDRVQLTATAARLKELEAMLAHVPEVDASRVNALRQAIADGKYSVDSVHVAEKLLAFERSLFGKE